VEAFNIRGTFSDPKFRTTSPALAGDQNPAPIKPPAEIAMSRCQTMSGWKLRASLSWLPLLS
jgi:hypothetical protein